MLWEEVLSEPADTLSIDAESTGEPVFGCLGCYGSYWRHPDHVEILPAGWIRKSPEPVTGLPDAATITVSNVSGAWGACMTEPEAAFQQRWSASRTSCE